MAIIAKLTLPSGTLGWRAVIKSGGRQVASKNFATTSAARTWAKRLEGDRESMPVPEAAPAESRR